MAEHAPLKSAPYSVRVKVVCYDYTTTKDDLKSHMCMRNPGLEDFKHVSLGLMN